MAFACRFSAIVALVVFCGSVELLAADKVDARRVPWSAGPLSPVQIKPAPSDIGGLVPRAIFAFPPFDAPVNDTIGAAPLPTGAVTLGTYNHVTITTNWVAAGGDPFSSEALFALATGTDPDNAAPIYKFLTPFANGADSGAPITLSYSGYLYQSYSGGDPISLFAVQDFPGSAASWNNLTITLDEQPLPAVPLVETIQGGSISGTLAAGEVDWFKFTYTGGPLNINTAGTTLSPSNDTMIALFNGDGGLEIIDDDSLGLLSMLEFADGELPLGEYYLAVLGFDLGNTFDDGLGVTSGSENVGPYTVNGISIPEPTALWGLCALGILGLRQQHRRD
jgi:hypothetical protein